MHQFLRSLLLVLTVFSFFFTTAQSSNYPPNSGKILSDATTLYNDGKFKQAIEMYKKVAKSDTNYHHVLNNLSLCYYLDSNYNDGYKMAKEGQKLYPEKGNNWYNLMGNNLDKLGKKEEALAAYNNAIKNYNFHYTAWYNKGVLYYTDNKYEEAKKSFQQCVLINPYYSGAHFYLGEIATKEGNVIPAVLSHATCLLTGPESKFAGASVKSLSALSSVSDDITKAIANRKKANSSYEMIEEIFTSKIALDRKYKLSTDLEDPIVRQLQVVLEKLEYNANDKEFAMQYYVPLFTKLYSQKQFEPMVYFMFSGLSIKDVQNYVKRNKKKLEEFYAEPATYFNEIRGTQTLLLADRKEVKEKYVYDEGKAFGKGLMTVEKGKSKFNGPWEFYYENGVVKSKGSLNENQEKNGEWQFFHNNGKLKEKTTFINGKPNGRSVAYFNNGILSNESNYSNGEYNGSVKKYYYNGFPKEEINYVNDKKNGLNKEYNFNGFLTYTVEFKDDKKEGKETFYFNNGKISAEAIYVKDEPEGAYKAFYPDGLVKKEGVFKAGKKSGIWKDSYSNGKPKSVTNYVNGEAEGESTDYYDNGEMQNKGVYTKGILEGKYEDFDRDGKKFSESFFEKGRLREIKFFDKSGTVISNTTSRNGAANLVFFDGDGNKTSEGYFTKEGLRNGKTTYYYRNGKVSSTVNYKEGVLKGQKVGYYPNGQISVKTNFEQDEENGFNVTYHENGSIKHEGNVSYGYRDGLTVDYNEFGEKKAVANYIDRDLEGFSQSFHPNGKVDTEEFYAGGWLTKFLAYDTLGNITADYDFPIGTGNYELKNYSGGKYLTGSYKNYLLDGENKTYFPDATVFVSRNYKSGLAEGPIKKYYFGGKLEYEGQYKLGEKVGTWNYYYPNGKLTSSEIYTNGSITGVVKTFNDDGTLDKEITYTEGALNGPYKFYGDNNQLALQLNFVNNKLVGYSYEDKAGKLVPEILIKKGSGLVTGFYRNGTKSTEINYEENEGEGVRKIYSSTGKLLVEGTRSSGYEHGVKKIYFTTGQLQKEENYYLGNLHGLVKKFYENGKLESEENWYNGSRNGQCKYYDTNGKLIQTRNYYDGTMVTIK